MWFDPQKSQQFLHQPTHRCAKESLEVWNCTSPSHPKQTQNHSPRQGCTFVLSLECLLLVRFPKCSFKQKENFLVPPMGWAEDYQLVIPTQNLCISWEALPQQCQVCVQNLLQARVKCSTNRDVKKWGPATASPEISFSLSKAMPTSPLLYLEIN